MMNEYVHRRQVATAVHILECRDHCLMEMLEEEAKDRDKRKQNCSISARKKTN